MEKIFLTIDNLTNTGYDRLKWAKIINEDLIFIRFIDVNKKKTWAARSYSVIGKMGKYKKIILGVTKNEQ